MLDSNAIDEYVRELTPEQSANVLAIRQLLQECSPGLTEEVCTGKWYTGLLTYAPAASDATIFALGPLTRGFTTFHMMPYYASASLQERHGAALKPFLTGKSCIKFKQYAELPEDALREIVTGGVEAMITARAALERRKK